MTPPFSKRAAANLVRVHRQVNDRRKGWLHAGNLRFPCALGRTGTTRAKREGDGATPVATLRLGPLHWRADRLHKPRTMLRTLRTARDHGWCDDVSHHRYNTLVRLPFHPSHEQLWRDDDLYDLVGELGWNMRPAIKGRGSAIFMHIARPGYLPTEGCVALRRDHLLRLLASMRRGARLQIIG